VLLAVCAVALACSSPAGRYVNYRLRPDRTPLKVKKPRVVAGLAAPVTILFDEYAVPHLSAANERDLAFGIGYVHARDRRFQMEMLKLAATGRLRELFGDKDQSGDLARLELTSRMIGLQADARRLLETTAPEDLAMLEGYAAGVNAGTAREPAPLEFRLLGYTPEPWTPLDSTLITALVSFGLNKNWEQELGRLEMILHQLRTGGTAERALAIWRPRAKLPPHLFGEAPAVDPFAGIAPIAPELLAYLSQFARQPHAAAPPFTETVSIDSYWTAFTRGGSNSNNWAMSGAWTGTGAGAFSSDPHMPHGMPPLGYLLHAECLDCDGGTYAVIGAMFVGLPAISFGTNGYVTWGPTSNWADVTDLYVERPAAGKPDHYEYRGAAEPFVVREEIFRVRQDDGTFRTETRTVRSTRHGVLLNDFVARLPADFPWVALQRAPQKGRPITAIRNLYRARTVTEARLALQDFSAMVGHWSLADRDGHVAYCGPVNLPKRTRHLGTVPVPGWTDEYEWREFVPIKDMPWIENPPTGFVGSANNQVIQPESQGFPINVEGDIPHRFARIAQVLGAGRTKQPIVDQLAALQLDNVDLGLAQVLPLWRAPLEALTRDADPLVADAARTLLAWDAHCRPDDVGPTIFHTVLAHVMKRTLEDEVAPSELQFLLGYFNSEPLVYGIAADAANPAWDDRTTSAVETADAVITQAFRDSVAALKGRYGPKVAQWRWRETAELVLHHPFGSERVLARYLNRGPLPTAGANNTVFKTQFARNELSHFPIKYGPVLRVMVDLSDLRASRMSIPGGQSGRPSSRHYADLLPAFMNGGGVSMDMDWEAIKKRCKGSLVLAPAED
jgi:penicillin amidase